MIHIEQALTELLGSEIVLGHQQIQDQYTTDWSQTPGVKPCVVIRPRTTEDVQKALRFCHEHRISVVPQGGLTGLVGAATVTSSQSVVISMEKMTTIESVDTQASTIQAQAGVMLETLQNIALEQDMVLGVDFGARGSCQIGGVVATNAGGNNVLQYGIMREQVLGLEVVLPDGTLLSMMRPMLKNNTGYDLKQLFIGSEGTLGIITRVLLRLYPAPHTHLTALLAIPDYEAALKLLQQLQKNFPSSVSAFELMWENFWNWSLKYQKLKSPFDADYPFYALIELDGQNEAALHAHFESLLESAFEEELLLDATVAQSQAQAQGLWKIREATAEFYAFMSPPINFDISIPVTQIDAFVKACEKGLDQRWPQHVTVCFGHIGDSNLHMSTDGQTVQGSEAEVEEVIYAIVGQFHGSVSAEHGIGLHKKPYLSISRSPQELATMKMLKQTLDPHQIMNIGKLF